MFVKPLFILISIALFASCSGKREIPLYAADCNGNSLDFSVKEKKHFAYTEYWMEIKIVKLKTIIITPQNVTVNSPYDFAMLIAHPHYFYDTSSNTIQPENITKRKMMLFINPDKYSISEFETIHTCLSQHFEKMEIALYEKYITPQYSFHHPKFAGIVYAKSEDFRAIYKGDNGSLSINFNGEIDKLDAKGKPIAEDVSGGKLVLAKQNAIDGEPIFTNDTEWMKYRNANTRKTFAEDYSFYSSKDNMVYAVRKN